MTDSPRKRGFAALSPERRKEIARRGRAHGHSFAHMDPERRSALARRGAQTIHARGLAYQWSHDEAVAAGQKGGIASRDARLKKKEVS